MDNNMNNKKPVVTFELDNGNKIIAELYPEVAPNTVKNYISLINKGFYDGLTFHRVIPGFMIQGGCPDGTGMGGPGHQIKGEFSSNGFANDLAHSDGVLSMARSQSPNSAGSQFFIIDGQYASFGKVIEGMDEVDRIANVKRNYMDMPDEPQVMVKVTVDTFGVNYDEPELV